MVEYYKRRSAREPFEKLHHPSHEDVWVHVSPLRDHIDEVAGHYGLDANIVRDACDRHELPRLEYSNQTLYVFLRTATGDTSNHLGMTMPLLAIIQPQRFITATDDRIFTPQEASVFVTDASNRPAAVMTAVCAAVVDEYEKRLNEITRRIAKSRQRLHRHEVKNTDFIQFVGIEDALNDYRSNLDNILGVCHHLIKNRFGMFSPSDLESLEDITLHIEQLLMVSRSNEQTISSIQSAYSTIANNVLNQRMKLLTAITILLAIPNVFYGMYGMNVDLPFQSQPWAYFMIVGFTVLLILLVFAVAKRFRLF